MTGKQTLGLQSSHMIMFSSASQFVIILLFFLCATTLNLCMGEGDLNVRCNANDQHVLSVFKQSVNDPSNRLSSWSTEEDCCKWNGVQCDNITGRVTKLDLHCPIGDFDFHDDSSSKCLGGEINFSLIFELEFLSFLDLNFNDFAAIHFPTVQGFENNQRSYNSSLKTSSAPTNFSTLLYLDLSDNSHLHMDNLRWVSHLSSLKYLNLSGITLKDETLWLQRMTMLSSLSELRLSGCFLNGINPSLGYVNFTMLTVLDISSNFIYSVIPKWLFNISSSISYVDLSFNDLQGQIPVEMLNFRHLTSLDLSYNNLNGSIPEWMGQFKHLELLDLFNNLLSGPIPATFGNLSSLTSLDVSHNHLNGSLRRELGQLSKLETLMIGYNSLSGILFEQSFAKLSNLMTLKLDSSSFVSNLSSQWQPPFQLELISMSYCKLGPEFPSWLYTQRSLSYLDVSSSGLSFNVDDRFWSFVSKIDFLFLSNNSISGDISASFINNTSIDLNSNSFRGRLPHLSPKVKFFNIANNSFSGPIGLLCQNVTGKRHLTVLDVSHNLLSGELPDCWMQWQSLIHVNLGSNNLIGKIPESMGSLIKLETLRLRNNTLSGNTPTSLKNCKNLWFLDLGFNDFTGNIPIWIGKLSMALLLRSNKFTGSIPSYICQFSSLLVLDLANNSLSGSIPKCLYKITTMVTNTVDENLFISYYYQWELAPLLVPSYLQDLPLFVKGQDLDYWRAFKLVRIVDLSSNHLSGTIPPELFSLVALQSLNLSHNHLMEKIPSDIGHIRFLESLDLSRNQLSGEIPLSMSNLSFLNHLNLSYNNFNGRIPLGTQLQSFEVFSYIGNPKLCGAPLPKNCTQEEKPNGVTLVENKVGDFRNGFNMGIGVGFVFGFAGVCATLFYIKTWRNAYFILFDNLYVSIAVKMNRLF